MLDFQFSSQSSGSCGQVNNSSKQQAFPQAKECFPYVL